MLTCSHSEYRNTCPSDRMPSCAIGRRPKSLGQKALIQARTEEERTRRYVQPSSRNMSEKASERVLQTLRGVHGKAVVFAWRRWSVKTFGLPKQIRADRSQLLDHERRAEEQVPLLLQMKQEKVALIKAIQSGDTDMVYHVLLHLRSSLSPGDFFHTLDDANDSRLTPALALLQVYGKQADRQLLRDFYYQDDRRVDAACLELQEAGETSETGERLERLKAAAKSFGEDKERSFEAKVGLVNSKQS